jgi:hypothetical protein
MNACGSFLFHGVANQTLKITTNSTMQINHFGLGGGVFQKTVLLDEILRTIFTYTVVCSRRFRIGPLANVHYPGSSFLEAASRLTLQ